MTTDGAANTEYRDIRVRCDDKDDPIHRSFFAVVVSCIYQDLRITARKCVRKGGRALNRPHAHQESGAIVRAKNGAKVSEQNLIWHPGNSRRISPCPMPVTSGLSGLL